MSKTLGLLKLLVKYILCKKYDAFLGAETFFDKVANVLKDLNTADCDCIWS